MRSLFDKTGKRATTLALIFAVSGGLALTSVAQQQQKQSESKSQQQAQQQQKTTQQQHQQAKTQQAKQQQQTDQQHAQQKMQQTKRQQYKFDQQAFQQADLATFEMAYPTGDADTSVIMIQQRAPQQVRIGQSYPYEITLTNLTEEPLAGVTLVQNLAKGMEFEGSEQQAHSAKQGQQRWDIGELEAGAAKTVRGSAIPHQEGAAGLCVAVMYEPAMCSVVEVVKPNLRLTKQGPDRAYICEDLTYTYTVTNTGSGEADNVRISESLPSGLQTQDGKNEVSIEVGSLDAGESQDFTVQLAASETGTFAGRAMAKSASDSVRSEEVQTQIIEADLRVKVNGPEWEYTERPVTYEVEVTNVGEYPAQDTVLTIATDRAEGDIQQASEQGQIAGNEDQRRIGDLQPGQTERFNITLDGSMRAETLRILAKATSLCAQEADQQAMARAMTEIRTIPALLLETVDNMDPVRIGDTTTYTITVKNQGTGIANNVAIVANLPSELEYVSASGDTEVKSEGQNKVTFQPIQSLNPGDVAMWTLEAKANSAADVRVRVELESEYLAQAVPDVEPTRLVERGD